MEKITQKQLFDGLCNEDFLAKLQQALECRVNHHENWASKEGHGSRFIINNINKSEIFARMAGRVTWLLVILRNQARALTLDNKQP